MVGDREESPKVFDSFENVLFMDVCLRIISLFFPKSYVLPSY